MNGKLLCLIGGFQHGGTTMLSELIRQHPEVDGRFETGFLMGESPSDFENVEAFPGFVRSYWGVNDEGMKRLTACSSFSQMYETLLQVSNIPDKSVQIYDKTPAYMGDLCSVMEKTDVPVVITVKDPRAILWSHYKREEPHVRWSIQVAAEHLTRYARSYKLAKRTYGDRILLVRNEHLCTEPEKYGKQVFDFLGLEWDDEYIKLANCYSKHEYVYGVKEGKPRGIVADRLTEWREHLTDDEANLLRQETLEIEDWHWE